MNSYQTTPKRARKHTKITPPQYRFYKCVSTGEIRRLAARCHSDDINEIFAETNRQLAGPQQHGLLVDGGDGDFLPSELFRLPVSRSENEFKELADLLIIFTDLKGGNEGWVVVNAAVKVDSAEISKGIVRAVADALR